MKCNQSRPGFELESPCPFPMTITITPQAPPALDRKHPSLVKRKGIIFHHNSYPHTTHLTKHLKKVGKKVLHPPYSPDFAPCDHHLFRGLQNHLNGLELTSTEEVQQKLVSDFVLKLNFRSIDSFLKDGMRFWEVMEVMLMIKYFHRHKFFLFFFLLFIYTRKPDITFVPAW